MEITDILNFALFVGIPALMSVGAVYFKNIYLRLTDGK
jgi:hypothetical protein